MCTPLGFDDLRDPDCIFTPEDEVDRVGKKHLFLLSQVCSNWHYIVMHAAVLWSVIVVDMTMWKAPPAMLIDLVSTSLARSRDHPLRIEVASGDEADSCSRLMLEMIGQHARRWRHFRLYCELSSFHFIMTGTKGNLPLLQTLDVANHGEEWTELGVFAVAPRLHTVTFQGSDTRIPSVPWHQLRHFDITSETVNSLALLPRLPSGASVSVCISWQDPPVDLPPITSPISALTLVLDYDPPNAFLAQVLGSLSLPRLTLLALKSGVYEVDSLLDWNQTQFQAFAKSHGGLTVLEIEVKIEDVEILECLSLLPVLEQLKERLDRIT
ncbi:hypothetical protein B0H11DRAFT_2235585 [Mycena galericulata]|nr:hypothetical protein B0H11DRAFT_2235585 [Mycena galericulata]